MKSNKRYLKWCTRQKKGIKIIKGSINLQQAYIKKSEESLKSMEVNAKAGIGEWVISTSYYAKYFAVYALLSRIGVKCEIHDCTVSVFEYLFSGEIPEQSLQDLQQAKNDRIETQYYTSTIQIDQEKLIADTKNFVLQIQEIIDKLNKPRIAALQSKLKTALQ